jgi:protein phosphatase
MVSEEDRSKYVNQRLYPAQREEIRMMLRIDSYGASDGGKVRKENEDQFLIADLNKSMLIRRTSLNMDEWTRVIGGIQGHLLLVADGMGGHAEGRKASKIAVNTVMRYVLNSMSWFYHLETSNDDDLEAELKSALERCQSELDIESTRELHDKGMGTTLTMAYLLWPKVYVVHAGDSRCYIYRKSRLEQVTTDHTLAQTLVDEGALRKKEADRHRLSNVLWNAIGGNADSVRPDVYKARLEHGDAMLLCTDGLTKHVNDLEIMRILETGPSAEKAANALIDLANEAGGQDNITVVVAYFRKADLLDELINRGAEAEKEMKRKGPQAGMNEGGSSTSREPSAK